MINSELDGVKEVTAAWARCCIACLGSVAMEKSFERAFEQAYNNVKMKIVRADGVL